MSVCVRRGDIAACGLQIPFPHCLPTDLVSTSANQKHAFVRGPEQRAALASLALLAHVLQVFQALGKPVFGFFALLGGCSFFGLLPQLVGRSHQEISQLFQTRVLHARIFSSALQGLETMVCLCLCVCVCVCVCACVRCEDALHGRADALHGSEDGEGFSCVDSEG